MAPYRTIVKFLGLTEENLDEAHSITEDFKPMTPRQILTYGVKEAKKFGASYSRKDLMKYVHYSKLHLIWHSNSGFVLLGIFKLK